MRETKERYELLLAQLRALLADEHDMIANMANASALLYETLSDINWAGFYLYKNEELILGPFQGKVACMHIPMGKGVCGTSAQQRRIIRVDDVHAFPGHIACDQASRSEIVLPLYEKDTFYGVLDIDAPLPARFRDIDEEYLRQFCQLLIASFRC